MIKVNVGMSRKVSKDFNSTGFSINLEGEVALSLDDPNLAIERIKKFYDLAEESLALQIERYESISAIASRDEEPSNQTTQTQAVESPRLSTNLPTAASTPSTSPLRGNASQSAAGTHRASPQEDMATNKQLQFLMTLGKRQGMNTKQLEELAIKEFGPLNSLYDLTKQQAGSMITDLNQETARTSRR